MTLVQVIQSKWPFRGRFERRSRSQIECDLEDEIAFHLAMKERELIEAGHAPDAACRLARTAFGDIDHIKHQCIRIAMEDHIMLQRIHIALTVLLALALVISIWMGVNRIRREREISMQNSVLAMTARVQAEEAHARAEAVQKFLSSVLIAAQPHASRTPEDMRRVLEDAARQVDRDFAGHESIAAELHRAIDEAKKKLDEGANGVD